MKFREYRHPKIRQRIRAAAEQWRNAEPGRSFESPKDSSLSSLASKFALATLFGLHLLFLASAEEDGPIFLSVVLPVVAILTFLRIIHVWSSQSASEVTYLFPFSNKTLSRHLQAETRSIVCLGAIPAFLSGAFGASPSGFLLGGIYGTTVYLSLLGCLTLSYLWKFFTTFTYLTYAAFILLFIGMIVGPVREINLIIIEATPWFLALQSPVILIGLLALGSTIAFLTKKHWNGVSDLDRTSYYQHRNPGTTYFDDREDEGIELIEASSTPLSRKPSGLFEKIVWRLLTPREKGLLRALRWHENCFIKRWLGVSALFFATCWLAQSPWPKQIEAFRLIAPFLILFWSMISKDLLFPPSARYLHGTAIAPKSLAPTFQVLPITYNRLEKLLLKDGILRWGFISLTIAISPFFHSFLAPTYLSCALLFFFTLCALTHASFLHFNHTAIKDWVPHKNPEQAWAFAIKIWLVIGVIGTLVMGSNAAFIIFALMDPDDTIFIPGSLIAIGSFCLIHQLIFRGMVKSLVSNPRADLIRQD